MRIALCAALAALACGPARALDPVQLFEKVSPSVWVVKALDASERPFAQGSAVVVGPGTLVTNCHVLAKAVSVQVRRANVIFEAKLGHADVGRDLCLLQVPGFKASAVEIVDVRALRVGQRVYAVGAPQGMEATLSEGLISGLRTVLDDPRLRVSGAVIQTTAPISQGSSGGGLFDSEGRLVGITTLIRRDAQNINIALPADWIAAVPERARAALAKQAEAKPALDPAGLPPVGTSWVYGFSERIFERQHAEITVRVMRVLGTQVEEAVTTKAGQSSAQQRLVDADKSRFFEYQLGAGAVMVELAPYLLASGGDGEPTAPASPSGYPVGVQGLPGWTATVHVGDWEEVSVPAGSYRALRLEATGHRTIDSQAVFAGRFSLVVWYAPEVKRYVRLVHRVWAAYRFDPKLIGHDVVELISYRPPS